MRENGVFDAILLIEEDNGATDEEYVEAFQTLIDEGVLGQLQGWYTREARNLIRAGKCKSHDEADDDEAVHFQRINDRMDGDHETALESVWGSHDDYRDDE